MVVPALAGPVTVVVVAVVGAGNAGEYEQRHRQNRFRRFHVNLRYVRNGSNIGAIN